MDMDSSVVIVGAMEGVGGGRRGYMGNKYNKNKLLKKEEYLPLSWTVKQKRNKPCQNTKKLLISKTFPKHSYSSVLTSLPE